MVAKTKKAAAEKTAAVVTIFNAPGMTPEGRKEVAAWLRCQAAMLVKDGPLYTEGRFTGRYIYPAEKSA